MLSSRSGQLTPGTGDSGLRWQVALTQEAYQFQRQPVCDLATASQVQRDWELIAL